MELQLHLNSPGSGDKPYTMAPRIPITIAGETIEYHLTPMTLLRQNNAEHNIGYVGSDGIFIDRRLGAAAPFAALFLHYINQPHKDREERLGRETIAGLNRDQVIGLDLALVLDYAGKALRPQDMAIFVQRIKEDSCYDAGVVEKVLPRVLDSYSLVGKETNALITRAEASETFYFERTAHYLDRHHNNQHVRRSRLASSLQGRVGRLLSSDTVRAEKACREIVLDPQYKDNLPEVVALFDALAAIGSGKTVRLSPEASGLLYLCERNLPSHKKSPFRFLDEAEARMFGIELGQRENAIKILNDNGYFESARRRIAKIVLDENRETTKMIGEIGDIVIRIEGGDKNVFERARRALQAYGTQEDDTANKGAMVSYAQREKEDLAAVQEQLKDVQLHQRLAVTAAPLSSRNALLGQRAVALLIQMGLPTTDVTSAIRKSAESDFKTLEEAVRNPLALPSP